MACRFRVALTVVVALFAVPASASATTICVPGFHAACPENGTNVAEADLETAINTDAADGVPDTVKVAAGYTYTDANALTVAGGSDDLTLEGGGPSTVLTSSATGDGLVLDLNGAGSRAILVRDLTVLVPAGFADSQGAAAQIEGDTFDQVAFVSANFRASGVGNIIDSGTIEDSSFSSIGDGSFITAVSANTLMGGTLEIKDTVFDGVLNGISAFTPGQVKISRTRIRIGAGGSTAVKSFGGAVEIKNSLIETPSGGIALAAQSGDSGRNAEIEADGVTLVQTGGSGTALSAVADVDDASIVFTNSIASGYAEAYERLSSSSGLANIEISHSNTPAASFEEGPGTAVRTDSINADPLFADPAAGDFSLLPGSPSIDAGDPSSTLTDDFNFDPRPRDGDGNGSFIVDQGAFEAPTTVDTTPPDTVISAGPADSSTIATDQATFSFNGAPGSDTAKIQCKLDTETFADCTSPKLFTNLSEGPHTVSFRAEDAVGNQDATPATRTFTVDTAPPPDTTPPQTTIDSGPGAKAGKGSPRFSFSANEASTFECSLVKKGKAASFSGCTSPKAYKLKRGKRTTTYVFSARATDMSANVDASPATKTFKVKRKPKKK